VAGEVAGELPAKLPRQADDRITEHLPGSEVGLPVRVRRVRARRGDGPLLREQILDAAERILVEHADPEAVSIRAISEIVGVTAPSIYRHFEDKDALVLAACERVFDRFDDYLVKESADAADPLHELKAQAHAYVRFGLDNPGQYRVLFMTPNAHPHGVDTHKHDDAFDPERTQMKALMHLYGAVQSAIDQKLIAPRGTVVETALLLWSAVHGMVSLRIAEPELPWPDAEAQVDFFFQSVAFGICGLPGSGRPD
jgi:AcrR family transcriptional regulator